MFTWNPCDFIFNLRSAGHPSFVQLWRTAWQPCAFLSSPILNVGLTTHTYTPGAQMDDTNIVSLLDRIVTSMNWIGGAKSRNIEF